MAATGAGRALALQVLAYPVTQHASTRGRIASTPTGYLLTRDSMRWFWDHYLRRPEDGAAALCLSPVRADLQGLPPALVITAEYDPLCDEGEAMRRGCARPACR